MQRAMELYGVAKFALFATSYSPLFLLIIVKQVYDNYSFLHFGGLNSEALACFFSKFFVATMLIGVILFGFIGCYILLSNLKKKRGGDYVTITDVNNRNSESVGYIATYIIPFVFQDFGSLYEIFSIIFLLFVIYTSYVNSNMLLINPILSIFKYSLFEIRYVQNNIEKSGLVITKDPLIKEGDDIKISAIGFKLYYKNNK